MDRGTVLQLPVRSKWEGEGKINSKGTNFVPVRVASLELQVNLSSVEC